MLSGIIRPIIRGMTGNIIGQTPSLLDGVAPSLSLSFEEGIYSTLGSNEPFSDAVTFSRSTTGTYVDQSGVIQSADINAPRFNYSTGRRGLLMEGSRTNLCLYSSEFDNAAWAKSITGTGVTPVLNRLEINSTQLLPDATSGSDVGKGFTITGLCHDTKDNTLWVGNFGVSRAIGGTVGTPQIINLSLDGSTILSSFNVSSYMQGVAYDSLRDKIIYTDPVNTVVRRANKDGSSKEALFTVASLNGLAYDAVNDHIWVTSGTNLVRYNQAGAVQQTIPTAFPAIDHLYYDNSKQWLFVTYGVSNSAGNMSCIRVSDGVILKTYRFETAFAVEGISIINNEFVIANDGYYHNDDIVDPLRWVNDVQRYPFSYGVVAGTLPDYLKIGVNGGTTSADNSFIAQSIVSTAARTFSVYFKKAHPEADFTFSLRLDDSAGDDNSPVTPTSSWARYTRYRNGNTTTQRAVIIARGNYASSPVSRFWVQAGQLESAAFASSFIPTVAASVTRGGETCSINGVSSWYTAAQGTFTAEFTRTGFEVTFFPKIISGDNGTTNEVLDTYISEPAAVLGVKYVSGGSTVFEANISGSINAGKNKSAYAYQTANYAQVLNGGTVGTNSSAAVPTLTTFKIGTAMNNSQSNFAVFHAINYYGTRATNAQIQAATT